MNKSRGQKTVAQVQKAGPKGQGQKAVPLPPRREAQAEGGWSPNINYDVTAMLDRLFGQNRAEEGRAFQQYYDTYGR